MKLPWRRKNNNLNTGIFDICIYKQIGSGDPECCFGIRDMMEALASVPANNSIRLRLHCPGGDVMEGIAIWNLLMNSGITVSEVVVDGIAASMGGIFLQYPGAKRIMCDFTRLMIHNVSGGAYGSSEDLKQAITMIEGFEADLCDIISKRCGNTVDEVKGKWFDNQDHWFTPQEAVDAKLCDEIMTGVVNMDPVNIPIENLFDFYKNQFVNKNQNFDTMKISKEFATFLNVAEDTDFVSIENAVRKMVSVKEARITELTNQVTGFENEKKTARKVEFDALLGSDKKKFSPEQKTHFTAMFEKDPQSAIDTMKLMPDFKNLSEVPVIEGNTAIPENLRKMTFVDMQKNSEGSKFLTEIQTNNFPLYNELYKAQFGKDAPKD